jgi:hypothetical protein
MRQDVYDSAITYHFPAADVAELSAAMTDQRSSTIVTSEDRRLEFYPTAQHTGPFGTGHDTVFVGYIFRDREWTLEAVAYVAVLVINTNDSTGWLVFIPVADWQPPHPIKGLPDATVDQIKEKIQLVDA